MNAIKLFNTERELYFYNAREAAKYLNITEDQLLCFFNLGLKCEGWWIERPHKDKFIKDQSCKMYDWQTPTTIEGNRTYDSTKPLHILIKLIGYHTNNISTFGEFLKKFLTRLNQYLIDENISDDVNKEEVVQILVVIGNRISKNGFEPNKLLEMFEDLI